MWSSCSITLRNMRIRRKNKLHAKISSITENQLLHLQPYSDHQPDTPITSDCENLIDPSSLPKWNSLNHLILSFLFVILQYN